MLSRSLQESILSGCICKIASITLISRGFSINRAGTLLFTKEIAVCTVLGELTDDCQPYANDKEEKNGSYTINDKTNDVQNHECNHL